MTHETIITWTPRNLITIVVMVTIGWFFLHLLSVFAGAIGAQAGALSANEAANVSNAGIDVNAGVGF